MTGYEPAQILLLVSELRATASALETMAVVTGPDTSLYYTDDSVTVHLYDLFVKGKDL